MTFFRCTVYLLKKCSFGGPKTSCKFDASWQNIFGQKNFFPRTQVPFTKGPENDTVMVPLPTLHFLANWLRNSPGMWKTQAKFIPLPDVEKEFELGYPTLQESALANGL